MTFSVTFSYILVSLAFSFIVLSLCLTLLYRQHLRIVQLNVMLQKGKKELVMLHECSIGMGKYLKNSDPSYLLSSKGFDLQSSGAKKTPRPSNADVNEQKVDPMVNNVKGETIGFSVSNAKGRVDLAQSLFDDGASSDEMMAQLGMSKVEAELIAAVQQSKQWAH